MSDDKKTPIFEKILEIFSNFGDSIINIEAQLDNLNQTIRRMEYKLDELAKSQKEDDLSLESEYKRLEQNLNNPIFSKDELKDLHEMDKELDSLDDDSDLEENTDLSEFEEKMK